MRSFKERLRPKRTLLQLGGLVVALVSFSCGGMQIPDSESQEARLFSNKCSLCHGLPHPSRHSSHEWNHYLELMKGNMDKKNISHTENEINTIRSYLHRYSKKAGL